MITDEELKAIIGDTENNVKNEVMDYLDSIGIYHWRNNTGRRGKVNYGRVGSADIIGLLPNGRLLAVETKCKTKQSKTQKEFQHNIEANNGLYILAFSLEDLINGLALWKKQNSKPLKIDNLIYRKS